MEFDLRNNILFSGKTMATSGKFRFYTLLYQEILTIPSEMVRSVIMPMPGRNRYEQEVFQT